MEFNEYRNSHFATTKTEIEKIWEETPKGKNYQSNSGSDQQDELIGALKAVTASQLEKITNVRLNNFEAGLKAFNIFDAEKENQIIEEYRSDLVVYLHNFLRLKLTN